MLRDPDEFVNRGGRGGSVPVGTQVCVGVGTAGAVDAEDSTHPTHPSTTGTRAIEQALVEAGVFCLNRRVRAKVAAELEQAKVTAAHVELLRAHIAQSEPHVGLQRRYLAGLLKDADEVLQAVEAVQSIRQGAGYSERNSMAYKPEPMEGEDPEQFRVQRDAQIVYCRIHGDGRTAEDVAIETGWTVEQVRTLYTMGHQLYGGGA